MNASIIAVGSELLGTSRLDTNSLRLTSVLERFGIELGRKSVVGDRFEALVDEVQFALRDHDLLIITGGLGPTADDLTKDAVARAFNLEMEEDPAILRWIERRFAERGLVMPAVNARQAQIFPGQLTIANKRGSAPGFHLTVPHLGKSRDLWLFPGVPFELDGMIENDFEPWLRALGGGKARFRRVLKIVGMAESAVEEKIKPFYENHRDEPLTILAGHGEIQLHLEASGTEEEAGRILDQREQELRPLLGEKVFGRDDETLESIVGGLLTERGQTLSTAESCTGGLLASRITDVPGSSGYFLGGAVAYSAQPKLFMVGVDPAKIEQEGEVSEGVAIDLAAGVRRRFNSTYGVGITGIAGPGGGTEQKPVGTVHIAVANEHEVKHRRFLLSGSRELIKRWSTQVALDMLRLFILRTSDK